VGFAVGSLVVGDSDGDFDGSLVGDDEGDVDVGANVFCGPTTIHAPLSHAQSEKSGGVPGFEDGGQSTNAFRTDTRIGSLSPQYPLPQVFSGLKHESLFHRMSRHPSPLMLHFPPLGFVHML
jgi:hypothetical protein